MGIQLIEHDGASALRWGADGTPHGFDPESEEGLQKAYRKAVAEGLAGGQLSAMNQAERSVAKELGGRIGITKDLEDSICVAWWLPEELAAQLHALCPDGVPQEQLHLTLTFLGDPDEDGSGPWDYDLLAAICKLQAQNAWRLEGCVSGLGRFVGEGDNDVFIALVDIPELHHLRRTLKEELCYRNAVPSNSPFWKDEHGFVPHVTLGYLPRTHADLPPLTETIDVKVDNLTVAVGQQRATFMFPEYPSYPQEAAAVGYYASRAAAGLAKAGRVLSGGNMAKLQQALQHVQDVIASETSRGKEGEPESGPQSTGDQSTVEMSVEGELAYTVTKANEDQRFTLGPLYAPARKDAHGEYTDAETLQKALHEFVRTSADKGRLINLQHGNLTDDGITPETPIGEWVEAMAWPYEHTIKVRTSNGSERELDMPAGTVYVGVVWSEEAWPLVKSGVLNGYSLGGKAVRVSGDVADLAHMGDKRAGRELHGPGRQGPDWIPTLRDEHGNLPATKEEEEAIGVLRLAREKDEAAAVGAAAATIERQRDELDASRGFLKMAMDTIKTAFERAPGDTHIHIPEQNVTINEGPDALAQLLDTDEPEPDG